MNAIYFGVHLEVEVGCIEGWSSKDGALFGFFCSSSCECSSLELLWNSWHVLSKNLRGWPWVHVVYIEGSRIKDPFMSASCMYYGLGKVLKYQACSKSPATRALIHPKSTLHIHLDSIDTTSPLNKLHTKIGTKFHSTIPSINNKNLTHKNSSKTLPLNIMALP